MAQLSGVIGRLRPSGPTPIIATVLWPSARQLGRRLPQLLLGLGIISVGIALMVEAELGLAPYEVLNQGVSEQTALTIGQASIVFGLGVLIFWLPLRQMPGIGTLINIVGVGLAIDLWLSVFPTPTSLPIRVLWLVMAIGCIGWGIGLYIGAGLGPGPRDGIMTGLASRGIPVWVVRGVMEMGALLVGWLLGGTVGIGTVLFATIVPLLADHSLRRHSIEETTA